MADVNCNSNTGLKVVVIKMPDRIKFFLFTIYAAIRTSLFLDVRQSKSSWPALPLQMGSIGCPETLVSNYQSTLCNITEEEKSHLQCGRSLILCLCSHNFPNLNLLYGIVL